MLLVSQFTHANTQALAISFPGQNSEIESRIEKGELEREKEAESKVKESEKTTRTTQFFVR